MPKTLSQNQKTVTSPTAQITFQQRLCVYSCSYVHPSTGLPLSIVCTRRRSHQQHFWSTRSRDVTEDT